MAWCKTMLSDDSEINYFLFLKVPEFLLLALRLIKKHCLVIY